MPAALISSTCAGRMPPTAFDGVAELGLVDLVVAADDGGHEPAVAGHEEGGLGRALGPIPRKAASVGDRRRAGRRDLLEGQGLLRGRLGLGHAGDLPVGGVAAPFSHRTRTSSPAGLRTMNSWAWQPPMIPTSEATTTVSSPSRSKIRT